MSLAETKAAQVLDIIQNEFNVPLVDSSRGNMILAIARVFSEASFELHNSATVTVGTGQAFETLNEALSFYSQFFVKHDSEVVITLQLAAGYVMDEQVILSGGINLSFVKITSVDAEVPIDPAAITENVDSELGFLGRAAFGVSRGCSAPLIDALFRFQSGGTGLIHGAFVIGAGSSINFVSGRGILDAPHDGILCVSGAKANVTGGDFSGAGNYGLEVRRGGVIAADNISGGTTQSQGGKKTTEHGVIFNK